jgi:hypothetical protein
MCITDELEALQLPEFLGQRTNVTKEELEKYVKTNRSRLWSDELGSNMGQADVHYGTDYMTKGGENYRENLLSMSTKSKASPQIAQAPSIENLKVVRGSDGWGSTDVSLVDPEGREIGWMSRISRDVPDERVLRIWQERERNLAQEELDQALQFNRSHWGKEYPNTMVSTRLQDFGDINGKKGTLIDELQSDWHQIGKEKGYYKPSKEMIKPAPITTGEFMTVNEFAKRAGIDVNEYVNSRNLMQKDIGHPLIDADSKLAVLLDDGKPVVARIANKNNGREVGEKELNKMVSDRQFAANRISKDTKQREAREASVKGMVPDVPYKENWYQLGLKKSIIDAVKKGDDRIYLPLGKTVSDRYSLSHQLDSVYIAKNKETGGWFIDGMKDNNSVIQKEVKNDVELEDTVGKELAKKAIENPEYGQEYKGIDLEVGGKGMQQYYDKNYLNYLKKFAKRYGGEVGETEIITRPEKWLLRGPNGEKPPYIQAFDDLAKGEAYLAKQIQQIPQFAKFSFTHQTPMTEKVYYYEPNDKAKKSILKGLPLKDGGRVHMNNGGTPPVSDLDFYAYNMPTLDNSQVSDMGARGYLDGADYKFGQTKMTRQRADAGVPDVQYARYAEYGEPFYGGRLSGRITEPSKQAYNRSHLADVRYSMPLDAGQLHVGVTGVRNQNPYGTNTHIGSVNAGYGMPVDGGHLMLYGSHSPQTKNTMMGVNYSRRFGLGGAVKPILNASKVASRTTALPTAPKKITGQGFADILEREKQSADIAKQELAKMKQELEMAKLRNEMTGISEAHRATMSGRPIPNFQPRQVTPEQVKSAYEEMMDPQLNLPLATGGKVVPFKKPEMSLDAMRLKTMFKR